MSDEKMITKDDLNKLKHEFEEQISDLNKNKKVFTDEEIKKIRQEFDTQIKESLEWLVRDLQDTAKFNSKLQQQQEYIITRLEKHDATLFGNGKEGVVTTIALASQTLKQIYDDIHNSNCGLECLNTTLAVTKTEVVALNTKAKSWDNTAKDVSNMKAKIAVYASIITLVVTLVFENSKDLIKKLF